MLFDVELKETRITYNVVQVEAKDPDHALEMASELYEVGDGDSRSHLGQLSRLYVDVVTVYEV